MWTHAFKTGLIQRSLIAGVSPARSRQQSAVNSAEHPAQYSSSSHVDLRTAGASHNSPKSRDPSLVRGRITIPVNGTSPALQAQVQLSARAISPRMTPINGESSVRAENIMTSGLERRPSNSYGHHRQASIVHGVPQHSRNSSFATSPAMSHRSPQAGAVHNGFGLDSAGYDTLTSETPDYTYTALTPDTANSMHPYTPTPAHPDDRDAMDTEVNMLTQRRVDRQPSGKARREHGRSQSKHQAEQISVGEYALHHLFNSFVGQAEIKITQCNAGLTGREPAIEDVCGPGVDPDFDQLISALGHIARQKPKPLVDTIMFWRQNKGEAANKAQQDMNHARLNTAHRLLPRRNTEPVHMLQSDSGHSHSGSDDAQNNSYALHYEHWRKASQSLMISNYLLCRVLVEVYHQSDVKSIRPLNLEDRIFEQLVRLDPDRVMASPSVHSNWLIYGQLLGVMSNSNFQLISQRFMANLKTTQAEPSSKGVGSKETDGRLGILIRPMKHLCIKTQPESAWRESCDLIHALGNFLVSSNSGTIKYTYLKVLESLVFPVAASPGAQFGAPKWKEFLNMLNGRLIQMLIKPRLWLDAFGLSALLLCASPLDVFSGQWLSIVSTLQAKLKDKLTRSCALQGICRLVWSYLYRTTEALPTVMRKLEDVVKVVLPSGKKTYITTEPTVADPIIELIRIIGARFPDFCFKGIIFPLINSEVFSSSRDIKVEQLEPERIVIGIRAFLAVMSDMEHVEAGGPGFPRFGIESGVATSGKLSQPSLIYVRPDLKSTTEEPHSRPVMISKLDETSREYYSRFCEILGKITLICDNTFGGQAVLDEKFGGQTPKTPIADGFTFSRKDEQSAGADPKQPYYQLLHVAVQALPRCLSNHIPLNSLVNLLCTGTAHEKDYIAVSSAKSLKAIARESHAQSVTIGFARFIFNYDIRYSTMSDEGMLGPGHIENTLKLYLELLQIWIEEIKEKTKSAGVDSPQESFSSARSLQLDLTNISALVEEVESHGVFFLCSQSRKVRAFAVSVLRLVTEFDTAMGRHNPRIIQILDGDVTKVINPNDDRLTVAERSRLMKEQRKSSPQNTLIELCSSHGSYDSTLWFKIFPNLVRLSFDSCPIAVTLGREIVCARLLQMHALVSVLSEGNKGQQSNGLDRGPNKYGNTPPEVVIEQWKLYLIIACTTMTNAGAQTQSQLANMQHARNKSKSPQQGQDKISSARALFGHIIPLLSAGPSAIRDAIVTALGSVNIKLYRTLLESLQYAVTTCNEEAKERVGNHQRTDSNPQRARRIDRLRTEVTHVYKLTSRYLHEEEVLRDEWILGNLIKYTDDMRIFLSDTAIQNDWEFQTLRRHYCGLMEEVFEGVNRTKEPSRWMSFEARKAAFGLMEDWCGYSPNQSAVSLREDSMRQSALNQHRDTGARTNATAAIEIEKRDLRTAALGAMASLCVSDRFRHIDRSTNLTFYRQVQLA